MTIIITGTQDDIGAPLDDFLPGILLYAPGVAIPTAYMAIRQAAIQFCERTRLWRDNEFFPILEAEDVRIVSPTGSETIAFASVRFNGGDPLTPRSTDWLDEHVPKWREDIGYPRYSTQVATDTLRIVPGATGEVAISLILKPSQDCVELPAFMVRQHRETIVQGALARLFAIPNQPYSSEQKAMAYLALFGGRLDALAGAGTTGQQRARSHTRGQMY